MRQVLAGLRMSPWVALALPLLVGGCERGGPDVAAGGDGASPTTVESAEAADRLGAGIDLTSDAGAASGGEVAPGSPPVPESQESLAARVPRVEVRSPAPVTNDPALAGDCPSGTARELGVMTAPARPYVGAPLHILAATLEEGAPLHVRIEHEGASVPITVARRSGPPQSAAVTLEPEAAGIYRVFIGREGEGLACRKLRVARRRPRPRAQVPPEGVSDGLVPRAWETRRSWKPREEALFSAWVRELFHAPRGAPLAFRALQEALADPRRNPMYDSLGLGEDALKGALELTPDCADAPYFLRAYFAWKRGLPFMFHKCTRGTVRAPTCRNPVSNEDPMSLPGSWVARAEEVTRVELIGRFFRRTIGWGVHSGNGRVGYEDATSDLYPVTLQRESVRPGTVYADPYGHLFIVVELMPQEGGRPGVLYAIDGQPDGSITRKRFWAGNFLWNPDPSLGGSGFKRFVPPVRGEASEASGAAESGASERPPLVRPEAKQLRRKRGYRDMDTGVGALSSEAFFDRMDRVISPAPIDAVRALTEVVDALHEAASVRVTSVNNGVSHVRTHPDDTVEMPWGHDVFETVGPWENFSTPARDLRLLVAMDVVDGFVARVLRDPARFGVGEELDADALKTTLQDLRDALLRDPARDVSYTRTDGSTVTLSLAELLARAPALEVAYNPNDCPEVRWGAPEGSEERATCTRRAPADQQKKMEAYRGWFQARRRPRRGTDGPEVPGVPRPDDEKRRSR